MVNEFIRSVYNWMGLGLALTGFVSYYVYTNNALFNTVYRFFWFFAIGELALVFILASRIHKLKPGTATFMFIFYAVLNGATLSFIFKAYTMSSIASTFFICSGTFITFSIYGWTTKRDLTGLGQFMFMGVIGLIIASVVNVFLKSSGLMMVISYIGVFVFVGLTAYDTQYIKNMALTQPADLDAGATRKGAIIGALKLYLDFILMFQYLLMIFGGSRD
jgi:FtsH-binding integral membrane protein